jgi:hypothetical protein
LDVLKFGCKPENYFELWFNFKVCLLESTEVGWGVLKHSFRASLITWIGQVPHSQSSPEFLTQVLEFFCNEIHTILWSNIIIFTLECQLWIAVADIKLK